MSTNLKHMGGYTYKQLKGKSFIEIQKLFDKEMKRAAERRCLEGKEQQQESSKKQRMEEDKELDEVDEGSEDDEGKLMKHLVIKKDGDIAIDSIPLATKLPVIIDYKLHKEGMMVHYQLIRPDGSSKRYSSMIRMLQGIDREGLKAHWKIVKIKYSDIRLEDEFERVFWGDLKVMFKPDKRSDGRISIVDLDKDDDVTLVDKSQERQDDELMFDTGVLDTDEMPVEAKINEKDEQSTKLDDSIAGEAVTTASVEVVTTATTTTTTTRLKARGVVVQEPSKFRAPQEAQPLISKDKGKGIMIKPGVPLKRKDQIAVDEQIARDIQDKLDAELIEEQKLARKQEEEANITLIKSWENTQAMMEADRLLAERLQSK
ncbi:hypothetical protein Tco_1019552 [Tanacetum coccineum]|uniref:Uncharacterized protein n=1 Tax=Tanacetum coccineum TaxID=301880 RepID=A0ABQ5FXL3_9ASTR